MPRIPVYTTSATPTTATGKKSWGVRMNSRPFIEAALQKGDTAATAAGLITEFLSQRETRRTEAEVSQALIGAETFLSTTVTELSRASNPADVFSPDLTKENNWNASLMEIRNNFRGQLSPRARRLFDTKFQGIAAPYQARLQVKIDERINNLAISEFKVGLTGFEAGMADLTSDDANVQNFNFQLTEARNRGNRLVDQGRMTEEDVVSQVNTTIENAAAGALTMFMVEVPNPIEVAMKLQNDDDLTGEELEDLAAMTEHGAYVMHVLNNVTDPVKRRELVDAAVDYAFEEHDRNKQLQKEEDDKLKKDNRRAYNRIFSADETALSRKTIFDRLDGIDFMTPSERNVAKLFIEDKQLFADSDDDASVIALTSRLNEGELTTDMVINEAGSLTRQSFQSFMSQVDQDLSDSYKAALGDARVRFKYAEERGFDIAEYEQGAQSAYYRAMQRIRDMEFTSGSTMSAQQLRLEAKQIIEEEYLKLKPILQLELDDILKTIERRNPTLKFNRVNGRFNYETVAQELADHMATAGENARLEANLGELRYLLDMMRD
jgi:hypothetical protein